MLRRHRARLAEERMAIGPGLAAIPKPDSQFRLRRDLASSAGLRNLGVEQRDPVAEQLGHLVARLQRIAEAGRAL